VTVSDTDMSHMTSQLTSSYFAAMKYMPYSLFSSELIFCRALLFLNLAAAAALPIDPSGTHRQPRPLEPGSHPPPIDIMNIPHVRIKDLIGMVFLAGAFVTVAVGLATGPMLLYNLKATRDKKRWDNVVDSRNYAVESLHDAGDEIRYPEPVLI